MISLQKKASEPFQQHQILKDQSWWWRAVIGSFKRTSSSIMYASLLFLAMRIECQLHRNIEYTSELTTSRWHSNTHISTFGRKHSRFKLPITTYHNGTANPYRIHIHVHIIFFRWLTNSHTLIGLDAPYSHQHNSSYVWDAIRKVLLQYGITWCTRKNIVCELQNPEESCRSL